MALNGVARNQTGFALTPASSVGPAGLGSARARLPAASRTQQANQLWYRLNRSLLGLQAAAADLARPTLWNSQTAKTSDARTVSATAREDARPGIYAVGVTALAAAEKLGSAVSATAATPLGASGTFKLNSREVAVQAADTLTTLADQINKLDAKVQAKVEAVTEGGFRLTLAAAETGQAGALTLADTTPGLLTQLGLLDLGGRKATVLQAAADAVYTVNGQQYTSGTNHPVFAGVALELKQPTSGVTVTVTVGPNEEVIVAAARKFVEAYHAAQGDLGRLNRSGSRAGRTGAQTIQRELVSALQGPAVGTEKEPRRLGELGLRLDPGGALILDEAVFRQALAQNQEAMADAFANPTGAAERVKRTLAPLTSPIEGYHPLQGLPPAASWVTSQAFSSFAPGPGPRQADLDRQVSVLQSSLALLGRQQSALLARLSALFTP